MGATIIPGIAVLAMFLLPFFDRNPRRHWKQRKLALTIMGLVVLGMVALTIRAVATTPAQEEVAVAATVADQVVAGQDLYSLHCVECHGADGEGGEIKGVEGLEGVILKPINSKDEMYTRTDETLYQIIAYGQQDLGMPPFAKAFGGELSTSEIEYIVTFMRYTWDDRMELPPEAAQPSIPTLGADEIPSYEVHIQPIVKRYCISCHRPGKKNNNYLHGHLQRDHEIRRPGSQRDPRRPKQQPDPHDQPRGDRGGRSHAAHQGAPARAGGYLHPLGQGRRTQHRRGCRRSAVDSSR